MSQPSSKSTKTEPKAPTLSERMDNIERCVEKIATLSGNANFLKEFGLNRWVPSKKDMSKY